MSGKHFIKYFYLQFENNILSGKLSAGLVKKICLPDRMSGKFLNTFANTAPPPPPNIVEIISYPCHSLIIYVLRVSKYVSVQITIVLIWNIGL